MNLAIASLACRFPDAASRRDLWHNVLDGRRAFRPVPNERLNLSDYAVDLVGEADSITPIKAGLITDWRFDRARFRIPAATYAATDPAHWLALETAADAVDDAGGLAVLDRSRTAVVVANTLTGEFSRAAALRLRLPFLDRLVAEAAEAIQLPPDGSADLRARFAEAVRAALPEPQEESLAGSLANTIAGRIANFFDFRAGAFSVDGACASSLVAIIDAANLLCTGQADAVLVGAVDLSLDPFELVGFSRLGALARDEMRVFDVRSSGFWPGEGAAFALLLRADTARRQEMPFLTTLRGWGLSTDGAGGLTRPTVEGQLSALRRAHECAGTDPADLGYVEAHGTGTAVGDPIEVRALAALRESARVPLQIGSVKANIGHTKAAAGFAGLAKLIEALREGIIPPHVGCETPHPVFAEVEHRASPARAPASWPAGAARLAGVSSFGFGGVNAHVVLEAPSEARRRCALPAAPGRADVEPFFFADVTPEALARRIERLAPRAATFSLSELPDAASACAMEVGHGGRRVAVLARDGEGLARALQRAAAALRSGETIRDSRAGLFVTSTNRAPRVGFVFPGQASPSRQDGGAWSARIPDLAELLSAIPAGIADDPADTRIAQPSIMAASVAALRLLAACGVEADVATGHSLGEIAALVWGGALDGQAAVRLASVRGALMAQHAALGGGMLRLECAAEAAAEMIAGRSLAVACENASRETVVSGPKQALDALAARAETLGIMATPLRVSHAFHSPMVEGAAAPFAKALADVSLRAPRRPVISTVMGGSVVRETDLATLLVRQIGAPVRFRQALDALETRCDLVLEVGPGDGLSRLASDRGLPAMSVDAFSRSIEPLVRALAFAFSFGVAVDLRPLFARRPTRSIGLGAIPAFLANPCGRGASATTRSATPATAAEPPAAEPPNAAPQTAPSVVTPLPAGDALSAVLLTVADTTGLVPEAIEPDHRMLDDLHLNSLSVARLVASAAQRLGIASPRAPTEFANASVSEIAAALSEMRDFGPPMPLVEGVAGARRWVRTYRMGWRPEEPSDAPFAAPNWREVPFGRGGDCRRSVPEEGAPAPSGVVIRLAEEFDEAAAQGLLAHCQAAWADPTVEHLAICHTGAPVSAFARSLWAERRFASVRVIEHERLTPCAAIAAELTRGMQGFHEVRLDGRGGRATAVFAPARPEIGRGRPLAPDDVVLVTGGAKGIGAECALALGRGSGAGLVLVGRSGRDDPAVQTTLGRAVASGLRCAYVQADVCDAHALQKALATSEVRALGPITALLHAAGLNEPRRFPDIDANLLERTLGPKVTGLRNAASAAGQALRRIIAFGSIIGRIGLEGETHYALANTMQAAVAEELAARRPGLDLLVVEWSVWGGIGMAERLGTLERLAVSGVDALSVDDALAAFNSLVAAGTVGSIVVTSRFGPANHLRLDTPPLPIWRFIDRPLVHFPSVELVAETDIGLGRDPWMADHRVDGVAILPGAMALEATAQVASALADGRTPTAIVDIDFYRAVNLADGADQTIRIAALVTADGSVETVLRASDDGFAGERMRARFLFSDVVQQAEARSCADPIGCEMDGLYGTLFFNEGRFRRITSFKHVSARSVEFLLSAPQAEQNWFGAFEPAALIMGDPGTRDAGLHGLQACVPHRRVLPVGVQRISFVPGGPPVRVVAHETGGSNEHFVFDIAFLDSEGQVVESWDGARFLPVGSINFERVLRETPALSAAYVERIARSELSDESIQVAIVLGDDRQRRRARLLARLGLAGQIETRGDGRSMSRGEGNLHLSLSHGDGISLAVVAGRPVGCDIVETGDTRVFEAGDGECGLMADAWARTESLRKIGLRSANPAYPGRILTMTIPHLVRDRAEHSLVIAMVLGEATQETSLFRDTAGSQA